MLKKLSFVSTLLILLSALSLYYFFPDQGGNHAERLGYLSGYLIGISLWWLLLAFIMWRFIFKKKKGLGLFCFSILFSFTCIYQIIQIKQSEAFLHKARGERIFVINDISHQLDNPQAQTSITNAFSRKQFGDFATIFNSTRRLAAAFSDEEAKLRQAFDELNIDGILVPSTLGNKDSLIEARLRLKNFLQKINIIQTTAQQVAEKTFEEVVKARFRDGYLKKEFVKAFEMAVDAILQLTDEMYSLDHDIANHTDELLRFLQDNQPTVHLQDDKLTFDNPDDLKQVDEKIALISSLASKEGSVGREVDENQKKHLTRLLSCF